MSDAHGSRLERAMSAFLRFRSRGGERAGFLAEHDDLRDLLEPMLADGDAATHATDTVLGGDFQLEREIGRGGSGVVYAARQLSLGRRVAVKVLPRHLLLGPSTITRFRREAKTIATLDHPGIVRVLAVGTDAGTHWFAMELIEGSSLAAHLTTLRREGQPPEPWTRRMVQVALHLADALHYVHELGIVHRDVKPSNVLLRHDTSPVLTDFGLAHDDNAPTITLPGGRAGTPCYMAPEQVTGAGDAVDARSDVFALGATLYEMLTFTRAFDAGSAEASLRRVVEDQPIDPRRGNPGVSRDLAAIVATALAKEPARRYATAGALADDLRAYLAHRPVRARRPSPVTRALVWARRHPAHAALAATVALGVPTVAALSAFLIARAPLVHAGERHRLEELIDRAFYCIAHSDRDHLEAKRALDEAFVLAPDDPEVIVAAVLLRMRWGSSDGASPAEFIKAFSPAAQRSPEVQRALALSLRGEGNTTAAAAIERDLGEPRTAIEHQLAGWMSLGLAPNDPERRALRHFSLATRLAPRPRLGFALDFAHAADLADDATAREEAATMLVTLWPESSRAWGRVAWIFRVVDPPRARRAIERALGCYPDEPGLVYMRGIIREQQGDVEGACADLHRVRHIAEAQRALARLSASRR